MWARLGRWAFKAFARGAFEDNPYQESPLFRGMFFSSGEQAGELQSEFLSGLASLGGINRHLPGTTRGLFLHDFFAKVLPRDRNLFTPILEFLRWKLLTRNLGMASWLLFLFLVSGLLSLSYIGNLRAMNDLFAAFPEKPVYSGNIDENVVELASFRQRIMTLDELNSDWWVPRLGLDVSLEAQERVQALYCEQFKSVLLDPIDAQLGRAINTLGAKSDGQVASDFVQHLVWRIDLIENRLEGRSIKTLSSLMVPPGNALANAVSGLSPDLLEYLGRNYASYVFWTSDDEALREQQLLLKAHLGKVLSLKGSDFKWLVDWANSNPHLSMVTMRDFWGGPLLPLGQDAYVPPAFTAPGREILARFLAEMRGAMQDIGEFDAQAKHFWAWYAQSYYSAWYAFAERFLEGEGQLLTKADFRDMAIRMSAVDNPYYTLIARMHTEFAPLKSFGTPPGWVEQIGQFNMILIQYRASKAKGVAEVSEKAQKALEKAVTDIGGSLAAGVERHIAAADKLDSLMTVLADIGHFADTQKDAFKSASALYPGGGGGVPGGGGAAGKPAGKSPVDEAVQAINTLQALMGIKGRGEGLFWNLVTGPLDFILYVVTVEAACELQELWEGQVLAEIAHVPSGKLRENLFGKSGVVNAFTSGPAKPFLTRDARGWGSQSWFGIPFPFADGFFEFLDEGARGSQEIQPQYTVTLSTLPTAVNPGAKAEPYATLLEVGCGSEQQTLANFNYADEKAFIWKPDECGAVTLFIQFPGLELARVYEGQLGFAKFLKEFRQGTMTFTPDDFPGQAKGLEGLGVKTITVGYVMQGAGPVMNILDIRPVNVPDFITDCWQR